MENQIQSADIKKLIRELDKTHPIIPGKFPPILTTREVILAIAKEIQRKPLMVYDTFLTLGMLDTKQRPADLLLETLCAIRVSDLGTPDDDPDFGNDSYLMTIRGYWFLHRLMKHHLSFESLQLSTSTITS